ncbi:MAG: hypothetical protein JW804_01505 [Sedimentisphaerales bacterium]|nr:hypothetical protein [Sedimentisphaerales bacterium]
MKTRIFVSMAVIVICTLLISTIGCEPESNATPRQERLYSAENMELKKQIAQLEKKYEKDVVAKDKELQQCLEENKVLTEQIQEETAKALEESLTTMLMEQVQQLTDENIKLQAKVEQLENTQTKQIK